MDLKIFEIIDEQSIVCFTGKINLLNSKTKELIGSIVFVEGKIVNAFMAKMNPYKSLMNLFIHSHVSEDVQFVVEPELIESKNQKLDYPISLLKRKAIETIKKYEQSIDLRPSDTLQVMVKPEFIIEGVDVSPSEYSLLCTMSDYNLVKDIYINNEMLDYEITNALINLRKKDAIKVVETK